MKHKNIKKNTKKHSSINNSKNKKYITYLSLFFVIIILIFLAKPLITGNIVGNWLMFLYNASHIGSSPLPGSRANTTIWTYSSSGNFISPVINNNTVYVAANGDGLYALYANNGSQIWKSGSPGSTSILAPAIDDGLVYESWYSHPRFTPAVCGLTAYYINNGSKKWQYETPTSTVSAPTVFGGIVYIGIYHDLKALNATDGTAKWSFSAGESYIDSTPAVVNDIIYFGTYYFGSFGRIYALNATTGSLKWNSSTANDIHTAITFSGGKVYAGCYDGKVYAFNAITGANLFNYTTGGEIWGASPAIDGGIVYIGSRDNKLHAFNAANGAPVWTYTTGSYIEESPAIASGIVYFGSMDGNIYALNATNGNIIWKYYTGSSSMGSPAVINNTVYMGSGSNLYAFSPTPTANLVIPVNGTNYNIGQVLNFTCNATDNLAGLSAITLYIWNPENTINYTNTTMTSGAFSQASWNYSFGMQRQYLWNCFANNSLGNGVFASANKTFFETVAPNASIVKPENGSVYTADIPINFSCNATDTNLKQISLYIWNPDRSVNYTNTTLTSGNFYQANWSYPLAVGNYSWNCLAQDEVENKAWGSTKNRTFFDSTFPTVTLVTPLNGSAYASGSNIEFTCNATDANLKQITLYIWNPDGSINYTNTTSLANVTVRASWNYSLAAGNYFWNCLANDTAGNINFSTYNRTFFDSSAPIITINKPLAPPENTTNETMPTINVTIEETNPNTLWFSIDNRLNRTMCVGCTSAQIQSWEWPPGSGSGQYSGRLNSVAIDSEDNIIAAGYNKNLCPAGIICPYKTFLAKFDSYGNNLWSQYTPDGTRANSVAIDHNNNIIFGGEQPTYLFKYNSSGSQLWNISSGVPGRAYGLAVDSQNNIIVCGDGTTIKKYDSSGSELWSANFDFGVSYQTVNDVAVDSQDNIIAAGTCNQSYTLSCIAKYNSSGSLLWNITVTNVRAQAVAVDHNNNILIGSLNGDIRDYFIAKYDSSGSQIWNATYPIGLEPSVYSISVDPKNNIITAGSVKLTDNSSADFFLTKYNSSGSWISDSTRDISAIQLATDIAADSKDDVVAVGFYGMGSISMYGVFFMKKYYLYSDYLELPYGMHNLTVYANDSAGNVNSAVRYFTVDAAVPDVTIISPRTSQTLYDLTVRFDYKVEDASNIPYCSLFIDGENIANETSVVRGTTLSFTVIFDTKKSYSWKVTCIDEYGKEGSSLINTFTISTLATGEGGGSGIPQVVVPQKKEEPKIEEKPVIEEAIVAAPTATSTIAGGAGGTCTSNWKCSEWSECDVYYGIGSKVSTKQIQTCVDISGCFSAKINEMSCKKEIPIMSERTERCFKKHIMVYNNITGKLIADIDYAGKQAGMDISLAPDEIIEEYCDYCYDREKNFDETYTDCGGSCAACNLNSFTEWMEGKEVSMQNLSKEESILFTIANEEHSITVKEVNEKEGFAELTIESEQALIIKLYVGKPQEIDINGDGKNEISLTLNNLKDSQVDISIKKFEKKREFKPVLPAIDYPKSQNTGIFLIGFIFLLIIVYMLQYLTHPMIITAEEKIIKKLEKPMPIAVKKVEKKAEESIPGVEPQIDQQLPGVKIEKVIETAHPKMPRLKKNFLAPLKKQKSEKKAYKR